MTARRRVFEALGIAAAMILAGCSQSSASLPHRADWELFRQANSPDAQHCEPGTIPYFLDGEDGRPTFLECMRTNGNE
jgi:hypothetical protein